MFTTDGLGTISHPLTNGVPQMQMPIGHDQFDNAHRPEQLA
jgi:UDP:flavonoid glycosyltransferase YjiC (YdhE family)